MESLSRRNHPMRDVLDKELQQRTFPAIEAPCRLCHFMLTVTPASRALELQLMQQLAAQLNCPLTDTAQDITLPLYGQWLRWERHGEFSTYTFIRQGATQPWFDDPLDFLPSRDWFQAIPGQVFRIVQLTVISNASALVAQDVAPLFHAENCINSQLAAGKAQIWTDFQKHAEGAGRMLLVNQGLSASALGRVAQQLFDLGNYRKLSLLGWPVSQQSLHKLNSLEQDLAQLIQRIEQEPHNDEQLLKHIIQLAAATERLIAENNSRLQATAAYYQLTLDRLKALEEVAIDDKLSLHDFTARRLTPAFRTSESVQLRQNSLSGRLGRSTALLRTRINVKLEQQNQQLLLSMEQKAKLQLKLQQMIEGFSFVAISYYAVQLGEKMLNAVSYWQPQLNIAFWKALSVPFIVITVAVLLSWLSKRVKQQR
ncbi:DUF3422 domain-containing protein [Alishewanella tabrizica]|uniref:DUF3422 domain-containing protein n=1 Tax=Alishewanella tabrizica TaxID=671278 RepID=A0ABQ2WGH2_9ALTE|nr:DUF3422 domain-containing protein [Alishewanella tabrizica]GGW50300.1 hypothetical protein GCM10008111_02730 [Alishewanella tabrizica]